MKYIHFDTVMFLKDAKRWESRKKQLIQRLESMSELPSVNNPSGVRSGSISKPTQAQALERLEIEEELAQIELQEEMLQYGLGSLNENDKELVVGMYLSSRRNGIVVYEWGRKNGLNKDYVYDELHRILWTMGEKIEEK